jgi:hypothetical protein
VVLDHLLTQQKMLGSTADINIFTLKEKTQIFKMKKKKMEYEQVRKKNIFLHIYLFSSEMKKRRTTEREREQYYISLSLSFIDKHDKKEKERGGIQLMNNSLQAIFSVRTKENYLERI